MTLLQAVKSGFQNYFNFEGRASRSEFWWWKAFVIVFPLILGFIIGVGSVVIDPDITPPILENRGRAIGMLFGVIAFIPDIAVNARRLHDVGRSGWWQLIWLTVIGIFVLLYWHLKKGDEGSNHFGDNPLGSVTPPKHSDVPKPNMQTSKQNADTRINEDQLFTQVAEEMANDDIKAGIWAKATVHAEGDEGKTKAFYIKYRVQEIERELKEEEFIRLKKLEQDRLDNFKKEEKQKEAEKKADKLRKAEEYYKNGMMHKNKGEPYNAERDFKKSSELGHVEAQCELGVLYFSSSRGVRVSYVDAHKWFKLSADQGNATAQYYLGLIYKDGLDCNKDLVKAMTWFNRAASSGYDLATKELSKLINEDKDNYLTNDIIEKLTENEIRYDGNKFHYTGYAYDDLEAALSYAKSNKRY